MATAATFPSLAQVPSPNGAQAAATQIMDASRVPTPRGFRERVSPGGGAPPSINVPHRDSAMWFKQIHAGYMSAQFIGCVRTPTEFLHLYTSDAKELATADKWDPRAETGYDGTLKPRRISVWVQLSATASKQPSGDRFLDAIAHWSQFHTPKGDKLSYAVRLNIVASADAEDFGKRANAIQPIRRNHSSAHAQWAFRVSIRWFEGGVERMATEEFNNVPVSTDGSLALVQQTVVRLAAAHDAPLHTAMMVPITERVPNSYYNTSVQLLHQNFMDLVISKPSCTFDAAAAHPQSAPLENTGVVVRLCQRRMGEKGITHETAFHGALLSFGNQRDDAVAYAFHATTTVEGTMCAPLGMQEAAMALHVCAVHAEKRPLGNLITLYGSMGKCGEPIHDRGGTWVWVESAAVRPIDAALLKDWCVYPCAKPSLMPGNTAFHDAYRNHFARASALYMDIENYKLSKTNSSSSLATNVADDLNALPPRPDSVLSNEEEVTQRHVLAALRVGLDSKRTTIGEACAYLMEYDPPSAVVKMLMVAAGRIGVGASLSNMVKLCYESMQVASAGVELVEENAKLKRLVDVALAARATELQEPDAKRPRPVSITSNDRIKRMLKSLNLKAGVHANIHRTSDTNHDEVAQAICKSISVLTAPIAAYTALGNLRALKDNVNGITWENSVVHTLARMIDVCLRNAGTTSPKAYTSIFVLSSRTGSSEPVVFVERMTEDGKLATSTFDAMLNVAEPRLLTVNFLDKGQVRVTSTICTT